MELGKGQLPLVSVTMSPFNAERFMAAALGSILSPTCLDIEVPIVADGTADGMADAVPQFAARDRHIITPLPCGTV